ncbi:Oxoglutarate and iron-dependent oxygenase degradation C-term-domain-containing protein [Infundibulicybe gibba]|nr:Oxoglutarate and iron-dependent oxygenase degradation C-term-domain-containing protein [Infundibulicybe gibba]
MACTHERSRSPDSNDSASLVKRLKTSHVSPTNGAAASTSSNGAAPTSSADRDPTAQFVQDIFDHNYIASLHTEYVANEPFKYSVVEKLFQDDFELNFTEKETDIYKVNQTGDLASLNYLTSSQISLLPNLLTLRDALYSERFRSFLQAVTGWLPPPNHDDVIGTRRVSYIMYMPLPHYQFWQKDWGGALELYPTKLGDDGQPEPESVPVKSIPPSWNQFIFFEVQPGRVSTLEDGRERLSISGWFHAAQEGEVGYLPEAPVPEVKSSREQLTSTSTIFKPYSDALEPPLPDVPLSEEHIAFLSEFLNPVYLQQRTMKALALRFIEESSLELHSFLTNALAESLEPRLRELDTKDGLGAERAGRIPPHSAGTSGAWTIKGPPHKWRYCTLKPHQEGAPAAAVTPRAANASPAFRAWVAIVSRLLPLKYSTEARRFRPGLDYTLATSEEKEVRLDLVLGLTPNVKEDNSDATRTSKGKIRDASEQLTRGWQAAEWGGWECYMAPHNEEDDPAVYRSGSHKKASNGDAQEAPAPIDDKAGTSPATVEDGGEDEDAEMDQDEMTPGFNRLLLVCRDERVMRFVKYVSAAAEGSRWDICAEYEVGQLQEEGHDDNLTP